MCSPRACRAHMKNKRFTSRSLIAELKQTKEAKSRITESRFFVFFVIFCWIFCISAGSVSAQQVLLNGVTTGTSNGWGKGGKPKPTPTPPGAVVDGESDWTGTTNSDFNTGSNWTGVSGGSAPPIAGDVAWLKSTPTNKTINLS